MEQNDDRTMRLFFALWPDAATRAALHRLQAGLSGRLVRAENLHMTLAFLGNQPAALHSILCEVLDALPRTTLPLTLDHLGYFPRNRIVWAGTHMPPPALSTLHAELTSALRANDIVFDARASFKAHLTLARDAAPPQALPFAPIHWKANEVALVQSDMQARGLTYRVLKRKILGESGA